MVSLRLWHRFKVTITVAATTILPVGCPLSSLSRRGTAGLFVAVIIVMAICFIFSLITCCACYGAHVSATNQRGQRWRITILNTQFPTSQIARLLTETPAIYPDCLP